MRAILYSTKTRTVSNNPAGDSYLPWQVSYNMEGKREGGEIPKSGSEEGKRGAVIHRIIRNVEREALDLLLRSHVSVQSI